MPIRELLEQLMDQVRGAWRFRWLSVAVAWITCLVGWTAVMLLPPKYEASAQVYVDTRSILRPLLVGLAIDPDVTSGLDLVRRVLLSRSQVEQAAHATNLDVKANTPEERAALVSDIQSRIAIGAADVRARGTQGEGLYRISFVDRDRVKSIEVVQKMLDAFVQNAIGGQRTDQESTDEFFNANIAEIERRLREMELQKADFLKRNINSLPESQADYVTQLQAAIAAADTIRDQLRVAESRQAEIRRQLEGEEPFLFGFDTGSTSAVATAGMGSGDLTYRIQALEKQLDELLLQFTEKHPTVVDVRKMLESLKQRQAEELARIKSGQQATGSLSSSLKSNPIFQGLEMESKKASLQIAELRQDLATRSAKVAELRSQADQVPRVAADLVALNRDYAQLTQTYGEMIKRRETSSLTKAADKTATAKFKIIEPPTAPFQPISPNRRLLLSGVLVVALGLGAAMAWLLNQLRPVFFTDRHLAKVTGRTVLAAVSRTWADRHWLQRRREIWRFTGATFGLIVAFAGVQLLQQLTGL